MSDYQPSHSVVSRTSGWGNPEYNEVVQTVFEAAVEHADEARFLIDRDLLQRETVDVRALERLDAAFEHRGDDGETMHRCRDLNAALDVLETLMDPRTIHTFVAARRLLLANGDEIVLEYGPEHHTLTASEEAAPGVVQDVASTIEHHPAVLVPLQPLAEWEYDGRRYSIGRMLCVGRVRTFTTSQQCMELPTGFDPHEDALAIDLDWDTGSASALERSLSLVAGALGMGRPRRLRFDNAEDFEAARDALAAIQDGLSGNRGVVS